MSNLFLACKPQQRLMRIFQRKFSTKSLLQPEAPITVPALLVRRGGFGPCAPLALAGLCGSPGCTKCPIHTLRSHTLLPEASGEVQDAPDLSGQTLVTQPGPMTASLLLQPSENTVHASEAEPSFLIGTGRAESRAGSFLLSHF